VQKQNGSGTWNECTVCKYQVVTCRHDSVVYDYVNNSQHYLRCKKCNYVLETKAHAFEIAVNETTHQKICGHCNYKQTAEKHTFVQHSDGNGHWNSCAICGYNTDKINHKLIHQKDDDSHWLKCTDCDHTTDAAKHTFGEWNIITKPTEESKGEKERICTDCSYKEIAEIPPISHVHSYVSQITPPSCSSEGFTTHTCICGDSYIDGKTDMLDHASDGIWQADDNNHWNTCSECSQVINTASHEKSEWIIDVEADIGIEGKKHIECLICKSILSNEIINAITPSESDTLPEETENPDESDESEKTTDPYKTEKPTASPNSDNNPTIGEYVDFLIESGCSSSIISTGSIVLITVLAAIPMIIRKKHD
jgi:hypothetical protein